jgi:hypothetical protein
LAQPPSCPKLKSYWQFNGCQYQKASGFCAEPGHIEGCPLPHARLRNGNLNQLSYSLFLFIRDVAGGDIVTWIDNRLETARSEFNALSGETMREALTVRKQRNKSGRTALH